MALASDVLRSAKAHASYRTSHTHTIQNLYSPRRSIVTARKSTKQTVGGAIPKGFY